MLGPWVMLHWEARAAILSHFPSIYMASVHAFISNLFDFFQHPLMFIAVPQLSLTCLKVLYGLFYSQ